MKLSKNNALHGISTDTTNLQLKKNTILLLLTTSLILNGCSEVTQQPEASVTTSQTDASATITQKTQIGNWGFDTSSIAKDVKPGDDFYTYVNQGWQKTAKIPQGMSSIESFTQLSLKTEDQVADIIKDATAKNAAVGTPEQRIMDLYLSIMDTEKRNQQGIEPVKSYLADIYASQTRSDVAQKMARIGYGTVFGTNIGIDIGNPQQYILATSQTSLGLPNRDFYLNKAQPYAVIRKAYLDYIEGVLKRADIANAKQRAKAIMDFESKVAKLQWSEQEKRDPIKGYHVLPMSELSAYAPGFDWQAFYKEMGYDGATQVQLETDTSVKNIAALFAKTPVGTLRDFMAFRLLSNYAALLSTAWEDANFDFYSRSLQGIKEQRPLAKRAISLVSGLLGEDVGKLYVQHFLPASTTAKTQEMVGYILESMKEHAEQLPWMDDATRKEALDKLAKFSVQIGSPEKWHDLSNLKIAKGELIPNIRAIGEWKRKDNQAKLKEPVRRWEWGHMPHEVNAYYAPDLNGIVFLAAILQPPFFDANADPAVNFGALGAVIGHEISHGFDDQGSQFDGTGKLRNWWQKAASKNFQDRGDRLAAQYSKYSPVKDTFLNGSLTLGENIADLGGCSVSYTAYQKYVAKTYPNGTAPVLDGYTGNQRFFLGYAQVWQSLATDDTARILAITDVHSPGRFRANGVVRNFDPWYEAFGVTAQDKLYLPKEERVSIW